MFGLAQVAFAALKGAVLGNCLCAWHLLMTTADIDHFYNLKLKERYSTSYIRKMHQLLNQAFNQAVKWKKIAVNPVADADPPSVKYEEMSIWSLDEIQKFLQQCKGERHYLASWFH